MHLAWAARCRRTQHANSTMPLQAKIELLNGEWRRQAAFVLYSRWVKCECAASAVRICCAYLPTNSVANGVECVKNVYRLHLPCGNNHKKKRGECEKMRTSVPIDLKLSGSNRRRLSQIKMPLNIVHWDGTWALGSAISHFPTRRARVRPKKWFGSEHQRFRFVRHRMHTASSERGQSISFGDILFHSFVRFDFECYQFGMHKCWRLHTTCRVRWHNNNDFSSTFNVLSIFIPLLYRRTVIFATHSGSTWCRRLGANTQSSLPVPILRSFCIHNTPCETSVDVGYTSVSGASLIHSCEWNRLKCVFYLDVLHSSLVIVVLCAKFNFVGCVGIVTACKQFLWLQLVRTAPIVDGEWEAGISMTTNLHASIQQKYGTNFACHGAWADVACVTVFICS